VTKNGAPEAEGQVDAEEPAGSHSEGEEYGDEGMDQDDEDAQGEPDSPEVAVRDHPQESRSEKEHPG